MMKKNINTDSESSCQEGLDERERVYHYEDELQIKYRYCELTSRAGPC